MSSFVEVAALKDLGDGCFSFLPAEDWMQGRTLFGGVIAGAMTRAILTQVEDPARSLRSMTVSFVAPVRGEEVRIQTRVLRSGKHMTQVEAHAIQGEQVCSVVQGVFGASHAKSLSVPEPVMPEAAPFSEVNSIPYIEGLMPTFSQHMDHRWTVDSFPYSGAEQAHCQGWVKYRENHSVELPEIVGLLDGWPPPILSRSQGFVPGSSVTWMINFFLDSNEIPSSSENFWFYDGHCSAAHGGYADTSASFWTQDGKLVARSRQLVVEFSK